MTATARTRMLALAAAALVAAPGLALAQPASPPATPGASQEQTLQNNSGTRALDRAAGTNVSGAYPTQSDGMPGNPPGTAATRALDRAAGTNVSGAYPQNEAPDERRRDMVQNTAPGGSQITPPGGERQIRREGSDAQSGPANNTGTTPGRQGSIGGNTASQPEGQRRQTPGTGTGDTTTEAPSLETREVGPGARPDQK